MLSSLLRISALPSVLLINSGLTSLRSTRETHFCGDSSLMRIQLKSPEIALVLFISALRTLCITFSLPCAFSLQGNGYSLRFLARRTLVEMTISLMICTLHFLDLIA